MLRPSRLISLALLGLLTYIVFFSVPAGEPDGSAFDPVKLGALEEDVLRADRDKETVGLFLSLTRRLREENKYTWFRAVDAAFHRTRAMMAFRSARVHYDIVLPDIERTYVIDRDWRGVDYDTTAAAQAEIEAWMTRRRPEINTPDLVSSLLAKADAIRFNTSQETLRGAALERVRALDLRDQSGASPDWPSIRRALTESYRIQQQVLRRQR
jgi:hypothetical protein